jgi:hypothetical protein
MNIGISNPPLFWDIFYRLLEWKSELDLDKKVWMENEVSRTIDVSQWKLIRDREQVSEGESILNTIL